MLRLCRHGLGVFCCYSSSCVLQRWTLQRNETQDQFVGILELIPSVTYLQLNYWGWSPSFVLFFHTDDKDNTWSVKNTSDFINSMTKNQIGSNPTSATILFVFLEKSTQPSLSITELKELNFVSIC